MRRSHIVCAAAAILLTLSAPRAVFAEDASSKETWIAALAKMDFRGNDYAVLQSFVRGDPENVYATLRDGWPRIGSPAVRNIVLQLLVNEGLADIRRGGVTRSFTPNPHLLDLLELGLADPAQQVHVSTCQVCTGIAFREIHSLDEFQSWRREGGDRPIAELMTVAARRTLASADTGPNEERAEAYRVLLMIPFHAGRYTATVNGQTTHGISVSGLIGIRRAAAEAAGIVDVAARGMRDENHPVIRNLALSLLAHFAPDDAALKSLEPSIRREAPAALDRPNAGDIYDMLAQLKAPWVVDMLIGRLAETDASQAFQSWGAANALGNSGDPRAIPSLIALYDVANPTDYLGQVIERSLAMLTGLPYQFNNNHDGDWWRDWWDEHKERFPLEVRSMPFPHIAGVHRTEGFSLRRHSERRSIGLNGAGGYWLMSPGIIPVPSQHSNPGLVVIVSDQPYSAAVARSWQDVAGQAWEGRYLVAYLPHTAPSGRSSSAGMGMAVADVVRDAESRTQIDARRVFIVGEGAAGLSVYACSLEAETPFHGYLLISAPFRSAQLPPLTAAKGRRYFLLHSRSDRQAPYVLAEAGESLLKQHGATVQLSALDGDAEQPGGVVSRMTALHQAIQWLESARQPRAGTR